MYIYIIYSASKQHVTKGDGVRSSAAAEPKGDN